MAVTRIRFGRITADANDDEYFTNSHTVQVRNRNIVSDIALVGAWYTSRRHSFERNSAYAGITQIISDRGVEDFGNWSQVATIYRTDVTSVTFSLRVREAHAVARYVLYYWE